MIDPTRTELAALMPDRPEPAKAADRSSPARGASFDGILRDLEHSREAMLDMPAIQSANAVSVIPGAVSAVRVGGSGLSKGEVALPRAEAVRLRPPSAGATQPAQTERAYRGPTAHGHRDRAQASTSDASAQRAAKLEHAASPQNAAQLPVTIQTRQPVQIDFPSPEAIAGAPGVPGAGPGTRGDAARPARPTPDVAEPLLRSMPTTPLRGQAVPAQMTTGTAVATPEAAPTRAATPIALRPTEANATGTSVVSHVAADGAAIGIRVVALSQRSADSLLDRVREVLRLHGVESYELFLNGERINLAPPISGSRS